MVKLFLENSDNIAFFVSSEHLLIKMQLSFFIKLIMLTTIFKKFPSFRASLKLIKLF